MLNRINRLWYALLLSLLLLGCRGEVEKLPPLAAGATVLAFGDSVTFGTGAKSGSEDYPTLLAARTGWNVINAGIPGDTALNAKNRVADALNDSKPSMVIVELGGNDFLRRRPEPEVKEDLRAILRSVKQAGAVPVLVAVPELSLGLTSLSDSAIYEELAEEEKVWLVKKVFAGVLSDQDLRADRIHPNAQGYRVMTEGIARSLQDSGLLR
jgi:acyl-CoA thioesterase-1